MFAGRGCSGGFIVSSVYQRGEAAAGVSSLRALPTCCEHLEGWTLADSESAAGGVLVFSVDDRGEAAAVASSFPPSTRKEKLQREFPRREHYLLRAFEWLKGWTLADSEAAAVAGTERLRSRASACGETVRRGEGRPAAIAHWDFAGKLAVGAAAGRGRRRRRRRRRRRSWRRGLRPRRSTTAIGRLCEYF
jgi:hypothetical protein